MVKGGDAEEEVDDFAFSQLGVWRGILEFFEYSAAAEAKVFEGVVIGKFVDSFGESSFLVGDEAVLDFEADMDAFMFFVVDGLGGGRGMGDLEFLFAVGAGTFSAGEAAFGEDNFAAGGAGEADGIILW